MTNQNTTSPALHHQNQPLDSGSVHESQRRQLRLSLHRSHRNTCCVCFCFRVFYNFRGEKRRNLYCSSSSHQKSVSADDRSKHNKPSPSSPENQPPDFGSVHESQQQQLRLSLHRNHRHTCCVRVRRVIYNFPWREAAQLMCLAALTFSKAAI